MDPSQPFVYHISDPLQNLNLEVTLKQVTGSLSFSKKERDKKKRRDAKRGDSKDPDSAPEAVSDDEKENDPLLKDSSSDSSSNKQTIYKKTISWQEKVLGPRELALYSPSTSERSSLASGKSPRLVVSSSSSSLTKSRPSSSSSSAAASSRRSDSGAATRALYAERLARSFADGKEPLDGLTEVSIFTYVDVDSFVPKSALQTRLTTSATDNDPFHNPVGIAEATLPVRGLDRGVLPASAEHIKGHLARERPFKTMYVMASVDADVKAMKHGSAEKDEELIYGGPAAAGGPRFYEKMLCVIKAFGDGTIEATPGFSQEEPEDETNPIFASLHSLNVRQKEGPKLSTFRFSTPRGSVFEYTITNKNAVESIFSAERLIQEESLRDAKHVAERKNKSSNYFFGSPTNPDVPFFLHASIEIVSGTGFVDDGGYVYAEYDVSLPSGWSCATQCPGINWGGQLPPGESSLSGQTHLARPSYFKRKGPGQAFGTSSIPRGDDLFMGGPGRVLGVSFALLIAGGFLLGLDYVLWLLGALTGVAVVMGVSPSGQFDTGMSDPVVHFSHPINLSLAPPSAILDDPAVMSSAPSLLIQVSSKHEFQRHIVEGYGFVKVPTTPGAYEFNVKTWVPKGGIRSEMRNYFIGGAGRLHNLKSIEMPSDMGGASFLSKFGFRTESSGTIKVRMNIICQGPQPAAGEDDAGASGGMDSTLLSTNNRNNNIDSILSRVRKTVNARSSIAPSGALGVAGGASPMRNRPVTGTAAGGKMFTFAEGGSGSSKDLLAGGEGGSGSEKQDELIKRTAKMFNSTLDAGRAAEVLDRIRQRKQARDQTHKGGGGGGGGMNATA